MPLGGPMNEFAKRRAEKFNDSSLWSAEDALDDAKERTKGKNVMLVVHWWEIDEDNRRAHNFSAHNLTHAEHIALLEVAKIEAIDDWFDS